MEAKFSKLVKGQEYQESWLKEIKTDILWLTKKVESHATVIKQLEKKFK